MASLVYFSATVKIPRETYLGKLREVRETNLIKVITGMRRVGKSTILAEISSTMDA